MLDGSAALRDPEEGFRMTDFSRLRLGMVDGQIRVADVTDHRVLQAFLTVPREDFVPPARRDLAYLDARVPLGVDGRATLDPMTLAKLVQLADPQPGEHVLVVGCGLGYSAAIFSELAGSVVGLEVSPGLAAHARRALADRRDVEVVEGPLPAGAVAQGPYDLIFCDGSVAAGLAGLGSQLKPDGRIVAPAGVGRATKATVFRRQADGLAAASSFDSYGQPLPGFEVEHAFAF